MTTTARTYQAIRWGTQPQEERTMRLPRGTRGVPVAELSAISYLSVKNGKPDVYRHEFDKVDGRGPYLLEVSRNGTHSFPKSPAETASLGAVIDLEAVDPETGETVVIFTPFLFVCTTPDALTTRGGPVLLACPYGADYAIESRRNQPFVREHGIIG